MQTYVYFIQRGCGPIKIGVSDNPESRMSELQTGSDKPLRLLIKFPFENRSIAFAYEKTLHEKFAHHRQNGEWFYRKIMKELKVGGKRIIGGTYKNPIHPTDLPRFAHSKPHQRP